MRPAHLNRSGTYIVGTLMVFLCSWLPAWANVDEGRKNAAKSFAKEIEHAQFHKVYVPDFLDASGTRTEKGCFFASTFSTNLAKSAHNFEVVNRIRAQKQLDELQIFPADLQKPDVIAKAATVLGADAVLVGSASISPTDARLSLSLREATSGKEVHAMDYHEMLEPSFEVNFPATQSEEGHLYYFPGLDGVSQPKCIRCPDPEYTDEERRNRVEGTVLLSVAIDAKGAITDARAVKNPDDSLTKRSLKVLKKWRLEASRDPDGRPVAARATIEIGFHLLH